jgi:hypothetical protein
MKRIEGAEEKAVSIARARRLAARGSDRIRRLF